MVPLGRRRHYGWPRSKGRSGPQSFSIDQSGLAGRPPREPLAGDEPREEVVRYLVMILMLLTGLPSSPALADDGDFQYWSQYSFRLWQTNNLKLDFYAEARMADDASHLAGYFTGPRLGYQLAPNLSMALAFKRIDLDGADRGPGGQALDGRTELEISPRFRLSERWRFDSRHRVEALHFEQKSDTVRLRHRLRFTRSLARGPGSEDGGGFTQLFVSNELFHVDEGDFGWSDLAENRFVPLGGRWRFSEHLSIDVFFLVRHRQRSDGWRRDSVVGTFLSLKP